MDSLDNSLVSIAGGKNNSDYLHIYLKTNKLTRKNWYRRSIFAALLGESRDKFLQYKWFKLSGHILNSTHTVKIWEPKKDSKTVGNEYLLLICVLVIYLIRFREKFNDRANILD